MNMNETKKEVLFEITADQLETGLRGFPIGYCTTSSVDSQKGLFYAGTPVDQMAFDEPASVIFCLYHGRKGNEKEVEAFRKDLLARSVCSPKTIQHIRALPREGHPMKIFCAALLLMGIYELVGDYREDCLNLIARIPEIAAAVITHHAGWQMKPSKPELGYMENFSQMLNVPHAKGEDLMEVLKVFNVLHYDHGGGNLSTFVGKAIASGMEDLYGSLSGAMCALAGFRHGMANQDCLKFNQQVLKALGENAKAEDVEVYIRDKLANNELVFGFGHAVLRVEDPRATIFYRMAQEKYPDHPLIKMAMMIRERGSLVLKENSKVADPYPNVDAISGSLLTAAGFPYPEYYTVLFGLSRCVGIAIQIVYERVEARGGKGTPIVRPKYLYRQKA